LEVNWLPRVLIIEDERDLVLGLKDNLEFEGYQVAAAYDGEAGVEAASRDNPDLILLDVMLPKMNGLDVCRQLRRKGIEAPIIMLTARSEEMDKVVGLEVGADDYITKPFSLREVLARVRAALRRARGKVAEPDAFEFADVCLNFRKHQAQKAGKQLDLSPRELAIMRFLVRHREETVTREQLLDEVWGLNNYPFTRTVDNHIAKLRQKIEDLPWDPRHIITVHRVGYKFIP
jgi:DNA-binding response OmpR family regulator